MMTNKLLKAFTLATGLTAGATTLSFVSNASDNTAGFRVDNIKLVGTK